MKRIFKFFIKSKLYPLPLIAVFYAVAFFMGANVKYGGLIFGVCVTLSIVTVLYSIYSAFTFKAKKTKKQTPVKEGEKQKKAKNVYPIYFTVKQNTNYVFAEYEDRYELFLKTESGLKYIRTDKKGD